MRKNRIRYRNIVTIFNQLIFMHLELMIDGELRLEKEKRKGYALRTVLTTASSASSCRRTGRHAGAESLLLHLLTCTQLPLRREHESYTLCKNASQKSQTLNEFLSTFVNSFVNLIPYLEPQLHTLSHIQSMAE